MSHPNASQEESPVPGRSRGARLLDLARRWAKIALIACLAYLLPLPVLEGWLPIKDALVVAAAVVWMGKTLYDTLFYDHYRP